MTAAAGEFAFQISPKSSHNPCTVPIPGTGVGKSYLHLYISIRMAMTVWTSTFPAIFIIVFSLLSFVDTGNYRAAAVALVLVFLRRVRRFFSIPSASGTLYFLAGCPGALGDKNDKNAYWRSAPARGWCEVVKDTCLPWHHLLAKTAN